MNQMAILIGKPVSPDPNRAPDQDQGHEGIEAETQRHDHHASPEHEATPDHDPNRAPDQDQGHEGIEAANPSQAPDQDLIRQGRNATFKNRMYPNKLGSSE